MYPSPHILIIRHWHSFEPWDLCALSLKPGSRWVVITTLTNRMRQKWHCRTSKAKVIKDKVASSSCSLPLSPYLPLEPKPCTELTNPAAATWKDPEPERDGQGALVWASVPLSPSGTNSLVKEWSLPQLPSNCNFLRDTQPSPPSLIAQPRYTLIPDLQKPWKNKLWCEATKFGMICCP